MPLYRKILSQSWKITWQNKYLWFFGLFAGFLMSGNYRVILDSLGGDMGRATFPGVRRFAETGIFSPHVFSSMNSIAKHDPISLFVAIFILLLIGALFVFLIWLSVVSQASLVNHSAGYLTNKKNDFASGVAVGRKNFWPVFGLNVLIKAMIYGAFLVIYLPIFLTTYKVSIATNLLYFFAFIIFFPFSIAVSFVLKYAIAYVVVKGNGFIQSIKSGWKLFAKNWVISMEMALLLFLIEFLAGIAAILAILILAIPFFFLAFLFYKMASIIGLYLIIILATIIFVGIILSTAAIMTTFQISSWTAIFIELVNKSGTSKIARLADSLAGKINKK